MLLNRPFFEDQTGPGLDTPRQRCFEAAIETARLTRTLRNVTQFGLRIALNDNQYVLLTAATTLASELRVLENDGVDVDIGRKRVAQQTLREITGYLEEIAAWLPSAARAVSTLRNMLRKGNGHLDSFSVTHVAINGTNKSCLPHSAYPHDTAYQPPLPKEETQPNTYEFPFVSESWKDSQLRHSSSTKGLHHSSSTPVHNEYPLDRRFA